jgi:hypothetical protein
MRTSQALEKGKRLELSEGQRSTYNIREVAFLNGF